MCSFGIGIRRKSYTKRAENQSEKDKPFQTLLRKHHGLDLSNCDIIQRRI